MDIINFHTDETNYIASYDLGSWGTRISDIRYASRSQRNVMDLYIPTVKKESYPVIFFLHSGGLCSGDKTRHLALMLQGLQLGYSVIAMNYRLTNETDLHGIYEDAVSAIHYLKRNAKQFHLDPQRIVYCGETHGIHILTNLTIDAGKKEIENLDPVNDGTDCSSKGAILFYPVHHFSQLMDVEDREQADLPVEKRKYVETAMFQCDDYDQLRKMADDEHIHTENANENTPPVLVFHAMKDSFFSHAYSEKLVEEFWRQGADASLLSVSGGRHSWREDKFVDREIIDPMFAFINRCFEGK